MDAALTLLVAEEDELFFEAEEEEEEEGFFGGLAAEAEETDCTGARSTSFSGADIFCGRGEWRMTDGGRKLRGI